MARSSSASAPVPSLRLLVILSLALSLTTAFHTSDTAASPATDAGTAAAVVTISGDLPQQGTLSLADLKALGPVSATLQVHGTTHHVVGVPLEKVLRRFGFSPGAMGRSVARAEKRDGYRRVVVAQAPDGFQAVFSVAELCADMGPSQVLVVWESDGKPLPPELGRLRLAVPTDKEPSRSLHDLQKVVVVDLRKVVPPLASP